MVCGLRDGQVLAEVPGDWQRECVTASNREHRATTVQERVRLRAAGLPIR
jgi:hypothetical protein